MARRRAANDPSVRVELSQRQREVLGLIARGFTNGEIAESLGISLDGVKWHVREILSRLAVNSREEAADWWRSRGERGLRSWIVQRAPWFLAAAGALAGVWAVAVLVVIASGDRTDDAGTGEAPATLSVKNTVISVTDFAATAEAAGAALPPDALHVLRAGQRVLFACSDAVEWSRPSTGKMSETFTFNRFGNGQHPVPMLYALYLSDVIYQEIPWANSANIELYTMSGLNGGNDPTLAAPDICPSEKPSPDGSMRPQAIFFVGYRPVEMYELDGHAVVVVESVPGVLSKVVFDRPLCCAKGGPESFDRLDVVTTAGDLQFIQVGLERWQRGEDGAVDFALLRTVASDLPRQLPLAAPSIAYLGSDARWTPRAVSFGGTAPRVGDILLPKDPSESGASILILPEQSRVP